MPIYHPSSLLILIALTTHLAFLLKTSDALASRQGTDRPRWRSATSHPIPKWLIQNPKVLKTPDVQQRDTRLSNQGKMWCVPAAIANIVISLKDYGIPLADVPTEASHDPELQFQLVETLGRMMKTDDNPVTTTNPKDQENQRSGTDVLNLLTSLDQFLSAQHLRFQLTWHGWRRGGNYHDSSPFTASWLVRAINKTSSSVLLNVGFYNLTENVFTRTGGHYVTPVYAKRDREAVTIYYRDPDFETPLNFIRKITFNPIKQGTISVRKSNLLQGDSYEERVNLNAAGLLSTDKMYEKPDGKGIFVPQIAIIDAAANLVIRDQ